MFECEISVLTEALSGSPRNQFSERLRLSDCSFVAMVEDTPTDLPEPRMFESCHFAKSANGSSSGSDTPENVTPNSTDVVDCSSTLNTRSTRFSSEPGRYCQSTLLKYWRFLKFLRPVSIFVFEKMSPT